MFKARFVSLAVWAIACARGYVLLLGGCFSLALLQPVAAQGRPDIVWMVSGPQAKNLVFSPDGLLMASCGNFLDYSVKLWSVPDRALQRTLDGIAAPNSVAFSPDGQILAVGSQYDGIVLWRVADGARIRSIGGDSEDVRSLSISPDGETIASINFYGLIKLWRMADGELVRTIGGSRDYADRILFSPDGQALASLSGFPTRRSVQLWRVSDGALLWVGGGNFLTAAFSPDGETLLAGGRSTGVVILRVSDGTPIGVFHDRRAEIKSLAFSPDGETAVVGFDIGPVGSISGQIDLWHLADRRRLWNFAGYTGPMDAVAFSPDGTLVASGAALDDSTLNLFNASDGALLPAFTEHPVFLFDTVTFSPDGQTLASTGYYIKLRNPATGTLEHTLVGHLNNPTAIAFSPDGQTLASGGEDYTIRFWRVSDGRFLRGFRLPYREVWYLAFSPDGQTLAVTGHDRAFHLWNVADGRLLTSFTGHTNLIRSFIFLPGGQTLASAAADDTVKLWRVADGTLQATLDGRGFLSFSPDGRLFAAAVGDRVDLWRLPERTLLGSLSGVAKSVVKAAFSPDGKTFAATSAQPEVPSRVPAVIQLWRLSDGALLGRYDQETSSSVASLAFSPDGRRFSYARLDSTLVMANMPGF